MADPGTRRLPKERDARVALLDHAVERAAAVRAEVGAVDWPTLVGLLGDPRVVRYPVHVEFDGAALEPGEFAWAEPLGEHPKDGFRLVVHPAFEGQEDVLPLLVAYHLPSVNYGDVVTREVAEGFGAALLGLDVDEYYEALCRIADRVPGAAA